MENRYIVTAVIGLAMCLPATTKLQAQQNPPGAGVPVHTIVTLEPQKGNEIPTVNQSDVMVYEGKDRDNVTEWTPAQGNNAALELFVLLDDSSNMTLGTQLNDIKNFISAQAPTTKVGVAYMQNGIAEVVQNPTSDHAAAAKSVRLPMGYAGANASPYFSLSDLAKKWQPDNTRHEIVIATSGIDRYYQEPDYYDPYLNTAIDDCQRGGIVVYAIYTPGVGHFGHSFWQTYWGQLYLAKVADDTGGDSYYIGFTGPPVAFAPFLDSVSQHLQHQYILGFDAKPQKKTGLQSIKVRTEVRGVDLVAQHKVLVAGEK